MRDITYCSHIDCYYKDCIRHQSNAPSGRNISIADLNDGYCFVPESLLEVRLSRKKERLMSAVCKGTQKTNYRCDNITRVACDVNGSCSYCETIANMIIEEFTFCGSNGCCAKNMKE